MRRNTEHRSPSYEELLLRAHPNSAAKLYGFEGRPKPADIDRTDSDATTNTGFSDDYVPVSGWQYAEDPYQALLDEWDQEEDAEVMAAQAETAWDLGVSLPQGHPFAPVVDGRQAA